MAVGYAGVEQIYFVPGTWSLHFHLIEAEWKDSFGDNIRSLEAVSHQDHK